MSRKMSIEKQDVLIVAEYERLKKQLENIPPEKLAANDKLLQNCAFMAITLNLLAKEVKAKGAVYNFKNGKQQMIIENPAQKSYNTMINRYTTAMGKINDLFPKAPDPSPGMGTQNDGFDGFVANRGD